MTGHVIALLFFLILSFFFPEFASDHTEQGREEEGIRGALLKRLPIVGHSTSWTLACAGWLRGTPPPHNETAFADPFPRAGPYVLSIVLGQPVYHA